MRGALGVAVVYPLFWHYSSAEGEVSPGREAPRAVAANAASGRAEAEQAPPAEARTLRERLPAATVGAPGSAQPRVSQPVPARAAEAPQQPSVQQPGDPLAELVQTPELKEALARAAEIQRHAANPAELERAVQELDADPAKLARLKALADMLVQLPAPRGEAYLPSSGSPGAGTGAR
ncbi:MAG TPA: hypothetical protein VFS67_18145 [Polyangiaceae bacterium]|nr:hypothetical protein [Polyangiaceae bacterium]